MRSLFFSGKGGVGKTSLASATAVALADGGQQVLLVTTDPTSNLADVFEQAIGPEPRPISGVPGLYAQEIDAEKAAEAYRERALAPFRGRLPEEMLASIAEQLSGPCTVEVAGFDAFVQCLLTTTFDVVVFDTAPTGHTLRLLALPAAWSSHIDEAAQGFGQTCIGPVDQLTANRQAYENALARLQDPGATTFILVTQPDQPAVEETLRAARELRALGVVEPQLVVNGVIPVEAADHPFFAARKRLQDQALGVLQEVWGSPVATIPLLDTEVTGVETLRRLASWIGGSVHAGV
jgi:arsenite-transporting ATPase